MGGSIISGLAQNPEMDIFGVSVVTEGDGAFFGGRYVVLHGVMKRVGVGYLGSPDVW